MVEAISTLPVGGWGARRARGPLPLTKRWRGTFIALRSVAIAAGSAAAVLLLLVRQLVSEARGPTVLGFAAGAFAVFAGSGLLYSALRPKGRVDSDAGSRAWVQLSDVHPNFGAAVEAMEADAATSQAVRLE